MLDSDRIRIYLGLADPQVERLRQIAVETEKANVKTRAEIEVRSIELREALRADKPDRDEILKKVQEISDLRREMMKHNVEAILAAKAVLSPEQQRRVFSIIENRHEGGSVGDEREACVPSHCRGPACRPRSRFTPASRRSSKVPFSIDPPWQADGQGRKFPQRLFIRQSAIDITNLQEAGVWRREAATRLLV